MLTHLGVHLGHVSSVLRGIRGNLGTSKLLKAQGQLWLSETPNTHSAMWCSGAGDCITLLPHWQDSSKPYQGGKGTGCWTRSLLLPWMSPVLDLQEHIQIYFASVLMRKRAAWADSTSHTAHPHLQFPKVTCPRLALCWFLFSFACLSPSLCPGLVKLCHFWEGTRAPSHVQSSQILAGRAGSGVQEMQTLPYAVLHLSVTWVSPNTNQRG